MPLRRFYLSSALVLTASGCTGNIGGQDAALESSAAPARVRRLTRDEFNKSASAVLGTPVDIAQGFAAEDTILGFSTHERLQVTSLLADQIDSAAVTLAEQGKEELRDLYRCPSGKAADDCARSFIQTVGERAFRRPVTAEEAADLLALFNQGKQGGTMETGAELVLQALFSSASFLYRTELGPDSARKGQVVELTPYEVASELSFMVTGGPPDATLLAAAKAGSLSSPDEREAQARRLLKTDEARAKLRQFFIEWLGIGGLSKVNKNNLVYPDYSVDFRDSMVRERDAFLDAIVKDHAGSVEELLGANYSYVDETLASYYGDLSRTNVDDTGMGRVTLPPERLGILTQAGVMSTYAHFDSSSPIKRGKFVLTRLLCRTVPAPPANVSTIPPALSEDATTRERFAAHTNNPACASCHKTIDPMGFGMEDFDGLGQHRTEENGRRVDASGAVMAADGTTNLGSFTGGAQLARYLTTSEELANCVPLQLVRYAMGRDGHASDAQMLAAMRTGPYRTDHLKITEALVSLVRSDSFTQRRLPTR
ncbi:MULTISPECIES: DUF1592 domain-containing protein [Corallococcus]|uniref:DUF1592 domain-containing protein n=1 Tax=Corallococcus TaxID=83461 RepID=UPI001181115D|nr:MULTISPECIES: DUF1592 domain-containing protein [Corallococcus]NBD11876.1 DUF1592 domain-containing protein [Corallococcus silvisoli]TSC23538.1 DUF1592 domain-containing protein [Corallococcus sp. Z5C101001]